ncbi:hypothetical protein A8W25_19720 [Streptomyces sp. ERV7]|uniref:hypothetical protein n=1 Tax=Streptomyces sp. ERV7 TaxID=1322334 RepID=UPI0007F3E068|nr:hypothetical protein [Streptomyces sp. ERV7]OAR24605.1 hypothetical protein A8W25_19720 [Streptomyces sp. ERV7]
MTPPQEHGERAPAAAFEAATGDGPAPTEPPAQREAAVRVAFEGLLQIRRLMNTGHPDPLSAPASWERNQMVRAIALALEAAGIPPSTVGAAGERTATGYRVGPADQPAVVRVEWLGPAGSGAAQEEPEALRRCADALRPLGWEALEYRGARRHRYLEVEAAT